MVLPIFTALGGASGVGSILAGAGGVMSALGVGKSGSDAGDINRMNVAASRVNARRLRSANAKLFRQQRAYERRSYKQQRKFYQHRIRWAAEDARRAGFHPLFGVGQVGSSGFSPVGFQGQSDFSPAPEPVFDSGGGVDYGAALSNVGQALQGVYGAKAEIARDEAIASYYNSMTQRLFDPGSTPVEYSIGYPLPQPDVIYGHPLPPAMGQGDVQAAGMVAPGSNYGFQRVNWTGGRQVILPDTGGQGISEVFEDTPIYLWPTIWRANREVGLSGEPIIELAEDAASIAAGSAMAVLLARTKLPGALASRALQVVRKYAPTFWRKKLVNQPTLRNRVLPQGGKPFWSLPNT